MACVGEFTAGEPGAGATGDGGAAGNAATASDAVAAMSEVMAMVRLLMTEFRGAVRIGPHCSPGRCVRPVHTRSGLRNIPW